MTDVTSPEHPSGTITIAVTIAEHPCATSSSCLVPGLPATGSDVSGMLGMTVLLAVAVAGVGVGLRTWAARRGARLRRPRSASRTL